MKTLMIGLAVFSCAISAMGETFQMDRKGESVVEVNKSAGEYKVTCKFKPQTKFDKAVNAKFNDAKGDSLCKKGLARYLKLATNETLTISGLYSAAPVGTVGDMLCYSFGVPVSGCKVAKVEIKPKQVTEPPKVAVAEKPAMQAKPVVAVPAILQPVTNAVSVPETHEVKPEESKKTVVTNVVQTKSYLSVAKYKEVNGKRTTISHKEYQGHNFKSPKEFDKFCQQEFARIRALGEANLRAVRNFGK